VDLRYRNTPTSQRGVFLINGLLRFFKNYDKTTSRFGPSAVHVKVLPLRVTREVIKYLALVVPVLVYFAHEINLPPPILKRARTHMFWTMSGIVTERQASRALKQLTKKYMNLRMGFQVMRHLIKVIMRTPGDNVTRKRARNPDREEDFDDDNLLDDEIPETDKLMSAAFHHSVQTGIRLYGLFEQALQQVVPEKMAKEDAFGRGWHARIGMGDNVDLIVPARGEGSPFDFDDMKQALSDIIKRDLPVLTEQTVSGFMGEAIDGVHNVVRDIITRAPTLIGSAGTLIPNTVVHPSTLSALRNMFNDDDANFRSPFQATAAQAIAERSSHLLIVLRTGLGKSMLAMLPAFLDTKAKGIMVSPFVVLGHDLKRRMMERGLPPFEWTKPQDAVGADAPRLVLVSLEAAGRTGFVEFVENWSGREEGSKWLFVDESHQLLFAAKYRATKSLYRLSRCPNLQIVLMTSTVSPSSEAALFDCMGLLPREVTVIREPCTERPEHALSFVRVDIGFTQEKEPLLDQAVRLFMVHAFFERPEDRGIVFFRTKEAMHFFHKHLGQPDVRCMDSETKPFKRADYLTEWQEGKTRWLLGTSSLQNGLDYPHVTFIAFHSLPFTLEGFTQGKGRGGRDGRRTEVVLYYDRVPRPGEDAASVHAGANEMKELVDRSDRCRRITTSLYWDGRGANCFSLGAGCQLCDVCQTQQVGALCSMLSITS
jgi:hypothetical protein